MVFQSARTFFLITTLHASLYAIIRNELHYPTYINTHYLTLLLKRKKKRSIYVTLFKKVYTSYIRTHRHTVTRTCTPVRDEQGRHVHTNYNTGAYEFRNCFPLLFATAIVRITDILFFRCKTKLSKSKLP